MNRINNCVKEYELATEQSKRVAIRKESNDLFEKLQSFSDDKVELAGRTYDLVDKNIKRLLSISAAYTYKSSQTPDGQPAEVQAIGYDMPLDPNEPKYCICHTVSFGEMIACDNAECPIEWFHLSCLNIDKAPKGKWYCGQCRPFFEPNNIEPGCSLLASNNTKPVGRTKTSRKRKPRPRSRRR